VSTLLEVLTKSNVRTGVALFLIGGALFTGNIANAQAFELPPAPEARPPRRAIEIDIGFAAPILDGSTCPKGERCLVGGGVQFSVLLERRGSRGFALGLGYELSLLDGHTVYEVSVLQQAFVNFRQYFLPRRAIHPYLSAAGGIGILGDSFRVDTAGVIARVDAGLEVELSENVAFTGAFGFQTGWFVPFTTDVDNVRRSRGGEPTVLFVAHVGLVIITSPR
jgi:hypothetical protein